MTNCTMILQSRSDSRTDTKTFRNSRSRTLSARISTVADLKEMYDEEAFCLSWARREDLSADLLPEISQT